MGQDTSPLRKKKFLGVTKSAGVFAAKMFLVLLTDSTPISLFFSLKADIDMNDSRPKNYIESDFVQ